MSRRLNQTYRSEELARLARQLLFAPPPRRREQVLRAERLHDELQPQTTYPLDYLTYRITHYRIEHEQTVLLVGEAVAADLRLMIDTLSRSFDHGPDPDEVVEPINQLAERLSVSVKTVERWRHQGLRWRWVRLTGQGRAQIVIPRKALERFSSLQPRRIESGSMFSQLPESQRQWLIERARRIAGRTEVTLNPLARHLAKGIGRAPETVRFILEKHDQRHPRRAIFPKRQGPLSARQKRIVGRAYRRGVDVQAMVERYHRSRSTIYRAIHEIRLNQAKQVRLSYHESRAFGRQGADSQFEADHDPGPIPRRPERRAPMPDDLPAPLEPLYEGGVCDPKALRHRLLRYHYLNYQADRLRGEMEDGAPKAKALDAFERYVNLAATERNRLVQANLPVVLSVARRQLVGQDHSGTRELVELLELALPVLIDAVQTHDPTRSQTFEAFLTNRLLQHFARQQTDQAGTVSRKAHRRLHGEQVVERMSKTAAAKGVDLGVG